MHHGLRADPTSQGEHALKCCASSSVSPPNSYAETLALRSDSVCRWDLWEVIKSCEGLGKRLQRSTAPSTMSGQDMCDLE